MTPELVCAPVPPRRLSPPAPPWRATAFFHLAACTSLLALSCQGTMDEPGAGTDRGPAAHPGSDSDAGPASTPPSKPRPDGGMVGASDAAASTSLGFAPAAPSTYVAKVKMVMLGTPPTQDEVTSVTTNPGSFPKLVTSWMERPEFHDKILLFFRNAFQQSQVTLALLNEAMATNLDMNEADSALLIQNVMESFPRTVWQLISEGRPFNEAVTTHRFMLTPPLMSFLAGLDNMNVNDKRASTDRLRQDANFKFVLDQRPTPIPIESTLDPASPDYMVWNDGSLWPTVWPVDCTETAPRVYSKANKNNSSNLLFEVIWGKMQGPCQKATQRFAAYFADSEFSDWRMVTIRPPKGTEATTAFYDLPSLRKATELVLRTPRVGFFTTPAFFANWATNESNQARVTMNQTLIVALGSSFDGAGSIVPVSESGLAAEHAAPGTECYGCHKTLDPMRQYFRQSFSLFYHDQLDPVQTAATATFAFDGVNKLGSGIADLAQTLASHPRFAIAWAAKLCAYATSSRCQENDPELVRIAAAFTKSNFNFKVLAAETFASPIVTGARSTATFADGGMVVSIIRRDAFCASLSTRLGSPDVCGLATPAPTATQRKVRGFANLIPADGYTRGSEFTPLPNDPDMFFRETTEKMCRVLADTVVDAPAAAPRYSSKNVDPAIDDFVGNLMGLPPTDGRAVNVRGILRGHYDAVVKAGGKPVDALKSTFVLSCMSPTSVLVGL